jgi:hypothetical protein
MIDQIWKPYTFFENSRIAHIHNIPSTNKFLRISSDGSILYSMRISVTTKCHHVTFHQMKNSSFSYCMELTILNDANIAKAILILI